MQNLFQDWKRKAVFATERRVSRDPRRETLSVFVRGLAGATALPRRNQREHYTPGAHHADFE